MELCMHCTTMQRGVRKYDRNLQTPCQAFLLEGFPEFPLVVANVMRWVSNGSLSDIARQLTSVERVR